MTEKNLIEMPMPEIKRYLAVGPMMPVDEGAGAGIFVAASDFDRIAAQKVAAVGLPRRRAVSTAALDQAACANSWNACLDACTPVVASKDARIAELEAEVSRLKGERDGFKQERNALLASDSLRNELLEQVKGERDRMIARTLELSNENAEFVRLLREIINNKGTVMIPVELWQRITAALSAYEGREGE